ncbi:MAG: HD domain-containing protein [Phycisphaerales bacterium]
MTSISPNQAIRALVMAEEAERLYGREHALTKQAIERALGDVTAATANASISLSSVRTGLIINRIIVIEPWAKNAAFARQLTQGGIQLVTFDRGLTKSDVSWLLDQGSGTAWSSSPSGRIHRSTIVRSDPGTLAGAAPPKACRPGDDTDITDGGGAYQLQETWTSLLAGERRIGDDVAQLAARMSAAMLANSDAMVPLVTLKSHDEYTYVHAINVGLIASALAQATGLSGDTLHQITEAALLHDVGKRLTPIRLLGKPGKLSNAERTEMQKHPSSGAALLAGVRGVNDLAVVAAYEHHMRIDGKGYPHARGDRTPSLCSQLIQIADVFDALRSDRPYRAGLSSERCLELLEKDSGTAFDRDLFEVFRTRVIGRLGTHDDPPEAAA